MIYADNAATTRVSEAARRAMMAAMETTWGNPSSLCIPSASRPKKPLSRACAQIAGCLNRSAGRADLHLRRQRGRQPGLRSAARAGARKGKKASHLHQIRASRHPAHLRALEAEGF